MAILTTIDEIPLFSTLKEALEWGVANGLQGHHTHIFEGQTGYMGGETHGQTMSPSRKFAIEQIEQEMSSELAFKAEESLNYSGCYNIGDTGPGDGKIFSVPDPTTINQTHYYYESSPDQVSAHTHMIGGTPNTALNLSCSDVPMSTNPTRVGWAAFDAGVSTFNLNLADNINSSFDAQNLVQQVNSGATILVEAIDPITQQNVFPSNTRILNITSTVATQLQVTVNNNSINSLGAWPPWSGNWSVLSVGAVVFKDPFYQSQELLISPRPTSYVTYNPSNGWGPYDAWTFYPGYSGTTNSAADLGSIIVGMGVVAYHREETTVQGSPYPASSFTTSGLVFPPNTKVSHVQFTQTASTVNLLFWVDQQPIRDLGIHATQSPPAGFPQGVLEKVMFSQPITTGGWNLTGSEFGVNEIAYPTIKTERDFGEGFKNTNNLDSFSSCPPPQACHPHIDTHGIAATACLQYGGPQGNDDWYLPSLYEFKEMYTQVGTLLTWEPDGGNSEHLYWTSTQYKQLNPNFPLQNPDKYAWAFNTVTGQPVLAYRCHALSVRPIRRLECATVDYDYRNAVAATWAPGIGRLWNHTVWTTYETDAVVLHDGIWTMNCGSSPQCTTHFPGKIILLFESSALPIDLNGNTVLPIVQGSNLQNIFWQDNPSPGPHNGTWNTHTLMVEEIIDLNACGNLCAATVALANAAHGANFDIMIVCICPWFGPFNGYFSSYHPSFDFNTFQPTHYKIRILYGAHHQYPNVFGSSSEIGHPRLMFRLHKHDIRLNDMFSDGSHPPPNCAPTNNRILPFVNEIFNIKVYTNAEVLIGDYDYKLRYVTTAGCNLTNCKGSMAFTFVGVNYKENNGHPTVVSLYKHEGSHLMGTVTGQSGEQGHAYIALDCISKPGWLHASRGNTVNLEDWRGTGMNKRVNTPAQIPFTTIPAQGQLDWGVQCAPCGRGGTWNPWNGVVNFRCSNVMCRAYMAEVDPPQVLRGICCQSLAHTAIHYPAHNFLNFDGSAWDTCKSQCTSVGVGCGDDCRAMVVSDVVDWSNVMTAVGPIGYVCVWTLPPSTAWNSRSPSPVPLKDINGNQVVVNKQDIAKYNNKFYLAESGFTGNLLEFDLDWNSCHGIQQRTYPTGGLYTAGLTMKNSNMLVFGGEDGIGGGLWEINVNTGLMHKMMTLPSGVRVGGDILFPRNDPGYVYIITDNNYVRVFDLTYWAMPNVTAVEHASVLISSSVTGVGLFEQGTGILVLSAEGKKYALAQAIGPSLTITGPLQGGGAGDWKLNDPGFSTNEEWGGAASNPYLGCVPGTQSSLMPPVEMDSSECKKELDEALDDVDSEEEIVLHGEDMYSVNELVSVFNDGMKELPVYYSRGDEVIEYKIGDATITGYNRVPIVSTKKEQPVVVEELEQVETPLEDTPLESVQPPSDLPGETPSPPEEPLEDLPPEDTGGGY